MACFIHRGLIADSLMADSQKSLSPQAIGYLLQGGVSIILTNGYSATVGYHLK